VFWVHASTQARFEEAYRGIADRLDLPERNDPKANVLQLVSNWLCNETNGQWMMVVDSVDNVETFFPSREHQQDEAHVSLRPSLATYLPQSHNGSILITSRSKDAAVRLAGGYNKIKEVLAMDEDQGLQLLQNKLQDQPNKESAVALLRALDYIPLAITQAAAYINRRMHMTTASYLAEFKKSNMKRKNLLDWDAGELRRDRSASNSIVTTWQISFEQIRQERPSAADLLSLMSCFNPQSIPESTLRIHNRAAAVIAGTWAEDEADSAFDQDLDTLQAYSLVAATADSNECGMHALVQFCTRVWLSSCGDIEHWEQRFVALMAQELPTGNYENWEKCQQLLPHVERLFHTRPATDNALKAWTQVLTNAAWYLWMRADYSIAQQLAAKAVAASETAFGLQNAQTLTSIAVLALVLRYQGKYNEAEKLNRRALEGYEKEWGVHHPSTLTIVDNLAAVLRYQGKYDEAEKLNRRALEGREKELGVHHPHTLTSVNNLAGVLQYQGKYDEAEKLNRRALEGYEKELGVHHPDTLMGMSGLASVLRFQGKYDEAETLNRRALEGYEKELGVDHPDTLTSVSNLAVVLGYQGKYDEAEKLNRRALEGKEKDLGVHHPSTLASVGYLAGVLQYQEKYDEAEKLNRRALEGYEKELGVHHPDTLTSVNNLAGVLQYQRKFDEAEKLNRRALEGREKELGIHHPYTLTSVIDLALVLRYQGKYDEAEKLNRRALEGYEKERGVHHLDTLGSVNNLAGVLQYQGKYDEAEKLNRRALEGYEKELGVHHTHTLTSVYCLARLLHTMKRYTEAAKLYHRAYNGYVQKLGLQHPNTIACGNYLSAVQEELTQAAPAEDASMAAHS
jgi:tetratricopeptide (TPR) repeat protein